MLNTSQSTYLVFWTERKDSEWSDLRVLPFYITCISLLLFLSSALTTRALRSKYTTQQKIIAEILEKRQREGGYANAHGSPTILVWTILRLFACCAFFGAAVKLSFDDGSAPLIVRLATLLTAIYAAILSVLTLLPPPPLGLPLPRLLSYLTQPAPHITIAVLPPTLIYGLRDVWPYATFDRTPLDKLAYGLTLWVMLTGLIVAGVVVPVCIPRRYESVDPLSPSPAPAPAQTASLLSLATFSFVSPLISKVHRILLRLPTLDSREYQTAGHIHHSDLPPLADVDGATALREASFKFVDPWTRHTGGIKMVYNSSRRHLWRGFVRYFAQPLLIQTLTLCGLASAEVLAPIATNRLLASLETGGTDATVRPWFWILCILAGSVAADLCKEWYAYIGTRNATRLTSIVTQLVFEHALRIRMKAQTPSSLSPKSDLVPSRLAGELDIGSVETAEPESSTSSTLVPSRADSEAQSEAEVEIEAQSTISETNAEAAMEEENVPSVGSAPGKKRKGRVIADNSKEAPIVTDEGRNLIGRINNLVTTDLQQIQQGANFLSGFIYAPLQIVLVVSALYVLLGWASLVGLFVMLALVPVSAQFAKLFHGLQKEKMQATDARVQTTTEVISMLRMIKFFAWEDHVAELIDTKRRPEMVLLWKRRLNQTLLTIINRVIPLVHMVVTFWVYTALMKKELKASIVFSSMTLFDLLRNQFFHSMHTIPILVQAKVSFDRIDNFLYETELLDVYADGLHRAETSNITSHLPDIGMGGAQFTWSANTGSTDDTLEPTHREYRLRVEGDLLFKRGGINLIVGPTGSGKTSLLMALLGEMHFTPTAPGAWCSLPREGGVAYAAQESWVQNETIRENVLFGKPYDEVRYKKVIYQCALRRDLDLFEAGDATEVGEKGLTLSGGQKARVTLARAIYSSASIIFLDDVLAALDVHTARWIVEKCFKGDLMRGRTVILVTHHVALTSPIADFVVTLGAGGRIRSQGSVNDVLAHDSTFRMDTAAQKQIPSLEEIDEIESIGAEFNVAVIDTEAASKSGKLVVDEEVNIGRMNWRSMFLLTGAMAGKWGSSYWIIFFVLLAFSQLLVPAQIWWLGYWAEAYEGTDGNVDLYYYLGIYLALISGTAMFYAAANVQYALASVRAATYIHRELIHSLLRTTLRWLDSTPTSRIITRCTEDIEAVDLVLLLLMFVLDTTASIVIKFAAVMLFTPAFILPGIMVCAVAAFVANRYMTVQLPVKREMSRTKAPVLAHFGAAIMGLVSIRAYGAQDMFKTELMRRIEVSTRATRCFQDLNRWVALRVDLLSCVFTAGLAAYMVYFAGVTNASSVGFSLNMAIAFSGMIIWWVTDLNSLELQGNSLERIKQYLVVEHEPAPTVEGTPPAYWPASGLIEVENLSARYSADGPEVLKDVSFKVESGARIGIVGRTGSGKSSLTLALLRTILTQGEVYFDGLPTSSINLDALRSNITLIPQIPELLSGTLRRNLDPFGEYDDPTLHDVLRNSGLYAIQNESDDVLLTLDSPIASGGGNLSVGQKQILALARAMLRKSKIIILDEATSAIDYETDALIQKSLRTEFKDVTLITVAHRLQTIMDADQIMVLDAGRLVEYDAPLSLLENEAGLFYSLVQESSDKDVLIAMTRAKAKAEAEGRM